MSKKYLFRLPLFAGLIAQANAQQLSISISPTNAPPDPLTSIKASASLAGSLAGDNRVYALGFDGESASVAAEVDVGAQRDLLSRGSSIYATIDDTTRRWDFSEATGFFGSPFSWKVPGSGFITQLEVLGGTPWAFANSTLYRLQANGQVTDFGKLPGWPDLKKIRSDGASSALPTGPYGSKKIN